MAGYLSKFVQTNIINDRITFKTINFNSSEIGKIGL